tara:strand:+ start:463 stop:600 length:138 start_codon:yes stop_codon:yes gene_type:complete
MKQKINFKQVSTKIKRLLSFTEKLIFEYKYIKIMIVNIIDKKKIK